MKVQIFDDNCINYIITDDEICTLIVLQYNMKIGKIRDKDPRSPWMYINEIQADDY